ncbi:uncharacterized protein LOC129799707 [Phlebotomus papatasi]|uniref:uncharacterized protein LOC129799707 n=1 Tax=Phlebotomus papatasi TaxID=29031 RepID=UPI00248340F1|nr:uncharacterized protein LOC129799707 [Phlebotomus papatasi]
MDFEKILEKYFDRMEMLKLHYKICLNKENHQEDCKKLAAVTAEVKELLVKCKTFAEDFPKLRDEYLILSDKTHRQRMLMLRLIEILKEFPKKPQPQINQKPQYLNPFTPPNRILKEVNTPESSSFRLYRLRSSGRKTPSSVMRSGSLNHKSLGQLHFPEFDFTITQGIFESVPKHMCGRINIDDIQNFLDTVINKCFVFKYRVLSRERNSIPLKDRHLYDLFLEQEKEFPNRLFITQGDITRCIGQMIDKRTNSRIQILRHIKVLQEVRKKTTIYYLWLPLNPLDN